jgi:rSAM/selenodomain-associated transferase 2
MHKLSIIIPSLNEESQLPALLTQLHRQTAVQLDIIVADGGSRDETETIAREFGTNFVSCGSGRGRQMNMGADCAIHPTLLFLHADSQLSDDNQLSDTLTCFTQALKNHPDDDLAAHFRLRFELAPDHRNGYEFYEAKTHLNRPYSYNGDQGLLVRKSYFDAIGGFWDTLPFLEDHEIAEKIWTNGSWLTLPSTLTTSARRFEQEGLVRRMLMNSIVLCFFTIRLNAFFERPMAIYKHQHLITKRLLMDPGLRQAHECVWSSGVITGIHWWYLTGRYVNANIWQLFFLRDVRKKASDQPSLRFYDERVWPIMNNGLFDFLAGVLAMAALYVCWAYFAIVDRGTA